jgi:hypothetical protein
MNSVSKTTKAETYRQRQQTSEEEIYISTMGVNDLKIKLKPEVPTRKFSQLKPIKMETDQEDDAENTTEHQQQQVQSSQACRPPAILLTSPVNLIQLQW